MSSDEDLEAPVVVTFNGRWRTATIRLEGHAEYNIGIPEWATSMRVSTGMPCRKLVAMAAPEAITAFR
jgi:hypothetical protein